MVVLTGNILIDILSISIALVAILIAYFIWCYQYWKRKNVPYLEPSIPFGNITSLLTRKESVPDAFRRLYESARAKGWKYCGVYALNKPIFLVADLDLAKQVMAKDFNHFMDRGMYVNERDDPLGCHLFSIGGEKWKNLRAKLNPTFTSGKLKAMFETLVDCGAILERYLEETVEKSESIDIKDVFSRFTINIIGSCSFGLDLNTFKEKDSPFMTCAQKFFSFDKLRGLEFAVSTNFPSIGRLLKIRTVDRETTEFFSKLVRDTVEYRERNNSTRKDFLQLLLDIKNNKDAQENGHGDGKTVTMDELTAQCFLFLMAGFESTSTAATFALYELALHQDIQDKVRQEIDRVLAKYDKITYDSLSELTYMKQVIDETLRKYPAAAFLIRLCVQDYKLPGEDLVIEKGTRLFIPIVGFHYDNEFYQNPSVFDPDRFSEENKKNRHPYAHIPFGEGPRICIGERFAVMQTKVGLTSILKNFRVTLNEKTPVPLRMSLAYVITSSEDDVWLDLKKI